VSCKTPSIEFRSSINLDNAGEVVVRMPPPMVETKRSAKGWIWILGMGLGGAMGGYFGASSAAGWRMPMEG